MNEERMLRVDIPTHKDAEARVRFSIDYFDEHDLLRRRWRYYKNPLLELERSPPLGWNEDIDRLLFLVGFDRSKYTEDDLDFIKRMECKYWGERCGETQR